MQDEEERNNKEAFMAGMNYSCYINGLPILDEKSLDFLYVCQKAMLETGLLKIQKIK